MGARGSIGAAARRLPWWGSASVGVAVVVALTLPAAIGFGRGDARYYGWYTSAEGSLHTGLILDQVQYTRLVDATAGRAPSSEVAPFTARALAPWLAGRLPLDAHVALTLVNLACLALGTFALARLAMDLTQRRGAVALAVAVWAIAFPVVKYTGDGFVDPAAVGLVPVVLLAIRRRWLALALAVFAAAVWMKETALVLLAVGIAAAWAEPGHRRARRLSVTALWVATAAVAYLFADLPGGQHTIVFAPWVPGSLATVGTMATFNVLTPPRLVAFGLTVLPAVFGVAMWWRGRRTAAPILEDRDAVPLVVGCAAGALVGLSAAPTAVLDGRSVWTTLPMGALLIAGWWASRRAAAARADLRAFLRGARWPVAALALAWIAAVALVPTPRGPDVLADDYEPRFTRPPSGAEDTSTFELEGRGPGRVEVPGDGPVLVEFEGTEPMGLGTQDVTMVRPGRVERGVTLFDPAGPRTLEVDAQGPWELVVRPVPSALFWESISPIEGDGPNVVVFPGGLPRPVRLSWSSADDGARVLLVGGCRLGSCGEVGPQDVVPAGTEALVVDASGPWQMVPSHQPAGEEQPVLPDTEGTELAGGG